MNTPRMVNYIVHKCTIKSLTSVFKSVVIALLTAGYVFCAGESGGDLGSIGAAKCVGDGRVGRGFLRGMVQCLGVSLSATREGAGTCRTSYSSSCWWNCHMIRYFMAILFSIIIVLCVWWLFFQTTCMHACWFFSSQNCVSCWLCHTMSLRMTLIHRLLWFQQAFLGLLSLIKLHPDLVFGHKSHLYALLVALLSWVQDNHNMHASTASATTTATQQQPALSSTAPANNPAATTTTPLQLQQQQQQETLKALNATVFGECVLLLRALMQHDVMLWQRVLVSLRHRYDVGPLDDFVRFFQLQ